MWAWGLMVRQCRFTDGNECPSLLGMLIVGLPCMGGGGERWEENGKSLYFLLSFAVTLKLLGKIKYYFFSKKLRRLQKKVGKVRK